MSQQRVPRADQKCFETNLCFDQDAVCFKIHVPTFTIQQSCKAKYFVIEGRRVEINIFTHQPYFQISNVSFCSFIGARLGVKGTQSFK